MSLQDLQIATAFFTLILVCLVFVSGNHQRVGEPLQASCGAVSSNVAPLVRVFTILPRGCVNPQIEIIFALSYLLAHHAVRTIRV